MHRSTWWLALLLVAGCGAEVHSTLGNVDTGLVETKSSTADRKVITEASIKLIVTELAELEREIPKLVKQNSGFLSKVLIDRTQGQHVSGHWVARVPVDHYDSFLVAVMDFGVPDSFGQTAQDVTEEYVDLEARISNEKRLEERILELAKRPDGEIKDVIEVEHELARVRGEIEKMEGRLRFLANRVAMTTVTIDAAEKVSYVPAPAPTFVNRIAQAWSESLAGLRQVAEHLVIAAVALCPWILIATLIVAPVVFSVRRRRKRRVAV